ncbi:hypothetical protein [Tolypothrix sp. VBCCA 56010]|uniref:hypothetical protein n=1 Tax=Tolypothrix sp. VBCCA 56010 TaxID=3137731 RepID=UPI003D7E513E
MSRFADTAMQRSGDRVSGSGIVNIKSLIDGQLTFAQSSRPVEDQELARAATNSCVDDNASVICGCCPCCVSVNVISTLP